MNTFLDRQSISHEQIDSMFFNKTLYKPQERDLLYYISKELNTRVKSNTEIQEILKRIKPEYDSEKLHSNMKKYAVSYKQLIDSRINSNHRFSSESCKNKTIDLPKLETHSELPGRFW